MHANKAITTGYNGCRCKYYNKNNMQRFVIQELQEEDPHMQDIEDLHKLGEVTNLCPYFLQKDRLQYADLILMPYNYLIDERIRENFDIDYKNCIIIIDEAHNINSVWESVASTDITETKIITILSELNKLKEKIDQESFTQSSQNKYLTSSLMCESMHKVTNCLLNDLRRRSIRNKDWPGFIQKDGYIVSDTSNIFSTLSDLTSSKKQVRTDPFDNITPVAANSKNKPTNSIKQQSANLANEKPISFGMEREENKMDWISVANIEKWEDYFGTAIKDYSLIKDTKLMIEDIFKTLKCLRFLKHKLKLGDEEEKGSEDELADWISELSINQHSNSFRIAISEENAKFAKMKVKNFGVWCFNPGFTFSSINKLQARSIILTSGTLAPMDSFADELQTKFEISASMNDWMDKFINPKQVCIGVLSKGNSNQDFTFTYKSRSDEDMLLDLGESIAQIVSVTPGGVLIFFPSYYLMQQADKVWEECGVIETIDSYQKSKINYKRYVSSGSHYYLEPKDSNKFKHIRREFEDEVQNGKSAVLMGVCRGKISEGLDFSDQAARCVIMIGIPFAQWKDPKVQLKMEYMNKQYEHQLSCINGRQWYNQEASRAVNQAIGRVIRHKDDYGLILLVDTRYKQQQYKKDRPKWLSDLQVEFEDFNHTMETIKTFFNDVKLLNLPVKAMKLKKQDKEEKGPKSFDRERWFQRIDGIRRFKKFDNVKKVKRIGETQLIKRAPIKKKTWINNSYQVPVIDIVTTLQGSSDEEDINKEETNNS